MTDLITVLTNIETVNNKFHSMQNAIEGRKKFNNSFEHIETQLNTLAEEIVDVIWEMDDYKLYLNTAVEAIEDAFAMLKEMKENEGKKEKPKKFLVNREYRTVREDLTEGVRTFRVTAINKKRNLVKVSGAINGVFPIRQDNEGVEFIALGMGQRNYCNPFATDVFGY